MQRTRVKICGITSKEDAINAVALGVDALGLVFYPQSARFVTLDQANQIASILAPFVSLVGLFVNPQANWVRAVLRQVPLNCLQFHGTETAGFCTQFNRPWFKALRVAEDTDICHCAHLYQGACGILLDTYVAGRMGGTGQSFNWNQIPSVRNWPLILSGGLNVTNIKGAIASTQPYAVDVSTGVEAAPGVKDPEKIAHFMREVTLANQTGT